MTDASPTLTMYKFVDAWGLPDLSPFCIKLETYLRMTGVAYQTATGDSRSAPKKKLPYVRDGERTIPDSAAVIDHLKATRGDPLDRDLSPRDRAIGEAFRAMLEEHHYFVVMYVRWCDEPGRAIYRPILRRYCDALKIPRFLHPLVIAHAGRGLRTQAWLQGTARHSHPEIMTIGQRHWSAVSEQLGDQPFLLGDQPTSVDATVYAFLISTIDAPFETPIKQSALADPRLVAYRDRMRERYWA